MKNHVLKSSEPIIIDITFKDSKKGYCCDVTRTYIKGEPKNIELITLYNGIKNIKNEVCNLIRPGVMITEINSHFEDGLRKIGIEITLGFDSKQKNNGKFILNHSIGHGIGKELHELPAINPKANVHFEKDMIIAIEPGAYNVNIGGIRLEDDYLITLEGCENLTKTDSPFIIN